MRKRYPQPPCPDRIRSIEGSFSWIDHRFLRQGFAQGLTRLEKLFYFVLIAVSNQDGVSFYSDRRLAELLGVHYEHELIGAREELIARDLIVFQDGIYQVLKLASEPLPPGRYKSDRQESLSKSLAHPTREGERPASSGWKSIAEILRFEGPNEHE